MVLMHQTIRKPGEGKTSLVVEDFTYETWTDKKITFTISSMSTSYNEYVLL